MEENKRKSALLFPFLFLLRRLAFTAVVIWFDYFVWGQIAMQFSSCITMVIYFGFVWPFESHTITKLEIFNEIVAINLCYFMLCFTDWVSEANTRYLVGWVFIGVICSHLFTHLVFLLHNSFMVIKDKKREKKYKNRMTDLNKSKTSQKRLGAKYSQTHQNGKKKRGETEKSESK